MKLICARGMSIVARTQKGDSGRPSATSLSPYSQIGAEGVQAAIGRQACEKNASYVLGTSAGIPARPPINLVAELHDHSLRPATRQREGAAGVGNVRQVQQHLEA
jgi:hypothetical protein